jgi:hypothetical protein
MITLDDVLRDLTYGEFSQLNLGNFLPDEHENEPDPKAYAQLCSWINLGLKAIYSEFWLATEEIEIQLYEAIGTYVISTDYSVTQGTQPTLYLIDSVSVPFTDNCLKIESVYDEEGNELPLNDDNYYDEEGNPFSLYTPTYRELQVPWPNSYNTLAVQFRASHPKITYTSGMDPAAIEVKIPHQLHEALLWYIASRGFGSLGGDQGAEGNDYYRKYQARVAEVKEQGLYIQTEPSNARFEDNGWC